MNDWTDDKSYHVMLNKNTVCRYALFGSVVTVNNQTLFRLRIEDNTKGDFMWMDMTPEQVRSLRAQMGKFIDENP